MKRCVSNLLRELVYYFPYPIRISVPIQNLPQAEARRQELCKVRALLSYQEEKLRRQNKIKSKKFRKILKKEKQKKEEKELAEALKADPDAVAC